MANPFKYSSPKIQQPKSIRTHTNRLKNPRAYKDTTHLWVLPNPGFVHRSVRYNTSGFLSFFFFAHPILWHGKIGKNFQKISKTSQICTWETHYQNFPNFSSTKFVSKKITGRNYKPQGTMKEGRKEGRMHVQLQGRSSVSPWKLFRFFAHIFLHPKRQNGCRKI